MSDSSTDRSDSIHIRRRSEDRSRWRLAYFFIASFGALTVVLYLYFSHNIVSRYAMLIEENDRWIDRSDHISELESLAQAANQPGNEVFLSRDIARAVGQHREAAKSFAIRLGDLRRDFASDDLGNFGSIIATDIDDIQSTSVEMFASSEDLFEDLTKSDMERAERRRATMNGRYSALVGLFTELRGHAQLVQGKLLVDQSAEAEAISRIESGVGILVLLLIIAATVYGHLISRQIGRDERDRDRYLDELRRARKDLHRANSELENRVQDRTLALEVANTELRDEVAARERVEQELREVLQRASHLASLVEFAADAVVGCDLSGTITSWNMGAERMLGY